MENQPKKPAFVPPVTEFTPEQDIEFARMHREFDDYNRAIERGEKPSEPEYDEHTFSMFRQWQLKRSLEDFDRIFPNGVP